jgi:hypothetical protein
LIVLVTISSWFAISNHCAFAIAASQDETVPNECPFHSRSSKPAKQNKSSELPCCKTLRAIAVSPAKNLRQALFHPADIDLEFVKLIVPAPPKICFRAATLDTGPPGATSFAELTGSMQAHAPPSRG